MATQSAGLRDYGRRRKNNEDFFVVFEPTDPAEIKNSGSLYIVADGVGGAAKGERASQFAAEKVLYQYYQPSNLEPLDRLRTIMEQVNDEIFAFADQNHTRMATTMVAAVVRGGTLYVANAGDSRAYLIRGETVTQITRDHSIVGELVEHGEMTETEAMASKIKNRLTRSLGGDPDVSVDIYPSIQLSAGDKILLCSDGITRYALREDISKLTTAGTPEEIAKRLIDFANQKGGADNIATVVVTYQGREVLEPTIVLPRPKPVDMDTLITQPEAISKINKRKRPAAAQAIAWLILAVGIFSAIALLGISYGRVLIAPPIPNNVTPSLTMTTTSTPTATPETAAGQVLNPGNMIPTYTASATLTETHTASPTNTPTFTATSAPITNGLCIAEVNDNNDTLYSILTFFQQPYLSSETYYHCTQIDAEKTRCEKSEIIENHSLINDGQWIIIPKIDQVTCQIKEGTWVKDSR